MGTQLNENEQAGRNYLKEKKPYVFEKVSKFTEKYQRGESIAIIQLAICCVSIAPLRHTRKTAQGNAALPLPMWQTLQSRRMRWGWRGL